MSVLWLEIHERVARYMAGDISLPAFREWFYPQAWNVDRRADTLTSQMVHEIDLILAEFDRGDWTEAEVKRHFSALAKENTRIYLHEAPWIQISTSAVLGSQPVDSTSYFGALPLFERPRIEVNSQR